VEKGHVSDVLKINKGEPEGGKREMRLRVKRKNLRMGERKLDIEY